MKKLLTLFLLPLFFLTACNPEEATPEVVAPDPVVKIKDLSQAPSYEVTEIGTLKAGQEVDLLAQSSGNISELKVKLGDLVTVNQTLALIGADKPNSAAQISLNNAQLQLNNAQQNLNGSKANNYDAVIKAQLRVQSLNATYDKLNRNLAELSAQNANTQTSLELQRSTVAQNVSLSDTTSSNLQNQFQQSSDDLLNTGKNTLDSIFVNLDSNLARINTVLNPENEDAINTSDVLPGLGEQDYSQLSDAVNTYDNYHWNLQNAKSSYEGNLPLSKDNIEYTALEAKQRVDEMRILLAETREMLNASEVTETLPAQALEAYKGSISAAEAATLGDLMKLDTLSQSISSLNLEESNKIASSQTNQVTVNNQLAEADNALQKFYITSNAAIGDLQAQIQQTQLDLQSAQADLASASRTAGILNSSKDLELSTLANQVKLAQNGLEDNKIIAKMDGVISELTVENGDFVGAGTKIGKIAQLKQITVVFYLPQEKASQVSLGQTFTFNTSGHDTQSYSATINKIAPSADPLNKKIQIEGLLDNASTTLKPETFVNIHLDLSHQTFDSNKVYVPMKAIIFGQNEKYVYVVENEMAVKRTIEIGNIYDEWVEVTSGLNQSDILIVEGQRNLPPEGGVKVNYGQTASSAKKTTSEDVQNQKNDQLNQDETNNNSNVSSTESIPLNENNTSNQPYDEGKVNNGETISPEDLLEDVPASGDTNSAQNLYPIPEGSEDLGTQ